MKRDFMKNSSRPAGLTSFLFFLTLLFLAPPTWAAKYELTRNSVEDPKEVNATDISLFRVKLGDSEATAVEALVEDRISGVRAEQEGTFILLWDKENPTGAMAGVRITDGKVDLIFINNRFAHKVRGIFRHVLGATSLKEIRDFLGPEDFPNETLMGAKLLYEKQGFLVNFLDRQVNVEFCLGCPDLFSQF
jgi:D-amino peptidase